MITAKNMSPMMVARFPALREPYLAEASSRVGEFDAITETWRKNVPNHILYSFVFNPYMTMVLQSDDDRQKQAIFQFIEELACAPDDRVTEVVALTICEMLIFTPPLLTLALPWMGRETRAIARALAAAKHPNIIIS